MKASGVSDLLFNQLNYRGERQKVISSNIANINTPHYKTKDLVFEHEMKKVDDTDFKLKVTNSKHIQIEKYKEDYSKAKVVDVEGLEEQNDGNNVNLDKQMSEMSKNSILYSALQQSIKKDSKLFRSVVESSGKN